MATVLIVDDEPTVVKLISLALERLGHSVAAASSGAEADAAAANIDQLDVLIVNHRIPPDSGRAIAERLLLSHPETKVMHVSGWSRQHLEVEGSLVPGAAFLSKPFTLRQVQTAVAELLAA